MTVDWSLIGDLEPPTSEITHHSLSHNEIEGYNFSNLPTGARLREEWTTIMIRGGALHEHWGSSGENAHNSYIMAPFLGSFIFISPVEKLSGDRTALEMHSMICDEPEHLVHEALETVGGVRLPPLHSVGLGTPHEAIEVVSDLGLRVGLSSWLFQVRQFRTITGVACGVPKKMLKKLFPHVSRWITETIDSPSFDSAEETPESDALRLMLHSSYPSQCTDTLYKFRILEEFSFELEIELRTLIPIHLNETHENAEHHWPDGQIFELCEVPPEDEMKARMILGDREDSLKLLISNLNLAQHWMENARTDYYGRAPIEILSGGLSFPFTEDELPQLMASLPEARCFRLLLFCSSLMTDYPDDSKILMADKLTLTGGQDEIEKIWKAIGPLGREGIMRLKPEILEWRKNDRLSDFWGLLGYIEGRSSTKDSIFRRKLALEVLSNSSKPEDIVGVVGYIPGIILTRKNYLKDWEILNHLGLKDKRVLLTVNQLQPSKSKFQKRLILYLEFKGVPKAKWRIFCTVRGGEGSINGLIPTSHNKLVYDYDWMMPILVPIERQMAYGAVMPEDANLWMEELSPREYLTCLKDKQMGGFIKKARKFHPKASKGWKRPRALRTNLVLESEWKKKKIWAQLIDQPSWRDRFAYYKGNLALIVGFLSILAMAYCVIITPPTVSSLGGSNRDGVLLATLSIILGWAVERVRRLVDDPDSGYDEDEFLGLNITSLLTFLVWVIAVFALFAIFMISVLMMNSMNLTIGSRMEMDFLVLESEYLGFDSITVPTLNTPFVTLLLVPILWQVYRLMGETRRRGAEIREELFASIGIIQGADGWIGHRTKR